MVEKAFLKNPIILALDVDALSEVHRILDQVGDLVGAIKLGPRLVYRYGADLVAHCARVAPVFVDNKYFDIPSTMVAAIKASFEAGATLATVHAMSGREALVELAKLEKELNKIRPFKILAVTILTSWDESSYPPVMQQKPVVDHVYSLAKLVKECGLSGVVCSAHELELLKDIDLYKVTPGIRPKSSSVDDQKRVMNPLSAINAGAAALVIGRPIFENPNPKQVMIDILKELGL